MDRVAVFIDAGYLFAQGSILLGGAGKLPRGEILLDHSAVASFFEGFAEKISGGRLLRIYWYDGTAIGPTAQHNTLAYLDSVKVRLGFVNSAGQQKGVDSLIVTDMITLARNRSMADAVLLSGDEDLRVGVQQAQEFGVRVHLVGIKPSRGSQSVFLMQEADTTHELDDVEVRRFLALKSPSSVQPAATAPIAGLAPSAITIAAAQGPAPDALEIVAADIANSLQVSELPALVDLFQRAHQVPRDIDAKLLAGARKLLGHDLGSSEKRRIREIFIRRLQGRLGL